MGFLAGTPLKDTLLCIKELQNKCDYSHTNLTINEHDLHSHAKLQNYSESDLSTALLYLCECGLIQMTMKKAVNQYSFGEIKGVSAKGQAFIKSIQNPLVWRKIRRYVCNNGDCSIVTVLQLLQIKSEMSTVC